MRFFRGGSPAICHLADMANANKLSMGDRLNEERTALANERTLLAYIRTALAFAITGASMLRFFDRRSYEIGGAAFLVIGAVCALLGFVRYVQIRRRIAQLSGRTLMDDEVDGG